MVDIPKAGAVYSTLEDRAPSTTRESSHTGVGMKGGAHAGEKLMAAHMCTAYPHLNTSYVITVGTVAVTTEYVF